MRLIFLGSGAFARPTLQWLSGSGHQVALVVTQPARGSGRGQRLTRTPVRALADELGLEAAEVENVNDPTFVEQVRALNARVGLAIAFGQKLGPEVLAALPEGCINLHASLLPKYRGAAPINWAILRGEERTGCTVFRIVERMDAGPILTARETVIQPEETAGELHDRLAVLGVDAVDTALRLYDNSVSPVGTPQDERRATKAPKLQKADGVIDFHQPAGEIVDHIRGVTPWPGATARFTSKDGRWETVTIARARLEHGHTSVPVRRDATLPPGTLDQRLYVAAADGFVEIVEIQPSSGRRMSWRDYVNGRQVTAGDALVKELKIANQE